jgi:hypothetical protein
MRLIIKFNYTFWIFFSWISLLAFFLYTNVNALIIFFIFSIFFGTIFYSAITKRYVALSIFLMFTFVSQAINAPFFFLNQKRLQSSSQWKLGDFNFDLVDFFITYKGMFFLVILVFIFCKYINMYIFKLKHFHNPRSQRFSSDISLSKESPNLNSLKKYTISKYSIYVFILILCSVVLNIFMYKNGIGIATVSPDRLPFKLVGITVYTRFFLIPCLLAYLFFKSKRSLVIVLLIIFYASFVSIVSMSKAQGLLILMPILIFSFIDNKKLRFTFVGLVAVFMYVAISEIRRISFGLDLNFFEILTFAFTVINFNEFSIPGFLFEFSDRLYGSQYTILVSNFNLENNIGEIVNFLIGSTESLSDIIAFDLFGIVNVPGRMIGVNIGVLNKILLLANDNYLILFFLAFFVSFCISLVDRILSKYLEMNDSGKLIGFSLSFIMILYLYDGVIDKFYILIILSLTVLFLINNFNFFKKNKHKKS